MTPDDAGGYVVTCLSSLDYVREASTFTRTVRAISRQTRARVGELKLRAFRRERMTDVNARAARHREAALPHERAAARHDEATRFWREAADEARADLEERSAQLERELAQLERDKAEVEETRPIPDRVTSRPSS